MSSVPQNKEELHQAITKSFDKIMADYLTVPKQASRLAGVTGNIKHSEISICDTVAYLIGWGKLVLKWQMHKSTNQQVDFPETGYKWNELGLLATSFHQKYQHWSYEKLLSEFRLTIREILILVESLDNNELYGVNWYKEYTLGKMIQFNTASPMLNMRTKVRKSIKTKL